ncbi:hypothetical protein ACWZHB_33050 [Nocardia sp. FBN12]|uniref:hypothetical protein n=1 Tax=Nocardia sp. FBN12 TaxID=3419766 RepID=UPI003D0744C3
MAANLAVVVVLVVAAWAGLKASDSLVLPMVLMVVPGSFPVGLVIAVLLLKQGTEPVEFRPIDDEKFAYVAAHPDFRAAAESMRGAT